MFEQDNEQQSITTLLLDAILEVTCFYYTTNFSSETAFFIGIRFHMEPPRVVGTKVGAVGFGHMGAWLPCPYVVKTYKNLL